MRVRTDARRQAIIDHAEAMFREAGYERTSMSQIAARVGGSKATLYGYFKSKQELFLAVMEAATTHQSETLIEMIDLAGDDPRKALQDFGNAYLDFVLAPEVVAVTRVGIAEGRGHGMGAMIYDQGPRRGWKLIAEHLQSWVDRGALRPVDTYILALHLRGLLEAGIVEPQLFGAEADLQRKDAVTAAVEAFLRAYGR